MKILQKTPEKSEIKENNIKTISDSSKMSKASLLIFLYFLQGLVIGIVLETMPMNLKKYFHYKEIGFFLMCSYPFSLKILWSFIVDTYYFKKLGLRKTWIILTQSIASLIFFYMAFNIEQIISEKKILFLSMMCFVLIFCTATQDIAVDGWALSLFGNDVRIIKYIKNYFNFSIFLRVALWLLAVKLQVKF
jgi:phage-related holin